MQIQFVKNIQFTRLVKADGRLREFNFRRMNGLDGTQFSIDVADDRGNRVVFRMHKEDSIWKIILQPLPRWIQENETKFHELIEEELKNY